MLRAVNSLNVYGIVCVRSPLAVNPLLEAAVQSPEAANAVRRAPISRKGAILYCLLKCLSDRLDRQGFLVALTPHGLLRSTTKTHV